MPGDLRMYARSVSPRPGGCAACASAWFLCGPKKARRVRAGNAKSYPNHRNSLCILSHSWSYPRTITYNRPVWSSVPLVCTQHCQKPALPVRSTPAGAWDIRSAHRQQFDAKLSRNREHAGPLPRRTQITCNIEFPRLCVRVDTRRPSPAPLSPQRSDIRPQSAPIRQRSNPVSEDLVPTPVAP